MTAKVNAGAGGKRAAAGVKGAAFAPLSFAKRDPDAVADRIALFEIDGVEYTVPAVVPTGESLRLLVNTNGLNESMRGAYLLETLAGHEALNALLGQAEMTDDDWHKLIGRLSRHAFGDLEEPGN